MEKDNIYYPYGKFCIEFESLLNTIVIAIIFAFSKNGMQNQNLTRILLTDLTAYPLISKYRSIITVIYENNPETIKYLEPLFKFLLKINEERNDSVHGLHWISDINVFNQHIKDTPRVKHKLTKNGYKADFQDVNPEYYNILTEKLKTAKRIVSIIQMCTDLNKDIMENIKVETLRSLE